MSNPELEAVELEKFTVSLNKVSDTTRVKALNLVNNIINIDMADKADDEEIKTKKQLKGLGMFAEELFKECIDILKAKGVDYASQHDQFLTIKRIAEMNDVPTRKVLGVFLTKHITTILRGVSTTEPMRGRIIDAINFLVLIEKWDTDATKNQ